MNMVKQTFYIASSLLLAAAMSFAQTGQGSTPSVGSQDQDSSMAGQAAGAILRGCLSGSADNYTLTDHNGTIYHLVGAASQLQNAVGHEVQIMGTPDARRTGAADDTMSNTASSFQVTGVNDVASTCDHRGSSRSGAMSESPNTDSHPKGAPGEGAPPQPQTEPEPHLMAILQQPASTDTGVGSQSSSSANPTSSTTTEQSPQQMGAAPSGQQTTPPPVTSQTPATSPSPTSPNAQMGTGTTDQTGTGTAVSGGATATPGTSTPSTSGAVNSGMSTSPSAAPTTQNDQNKPLYERQATDVPWASHSKGSTTTTTVTNPNGSSTTTTTTTPKSQSQSQPEPQQ